MAASAAAAGSIPGLCPSYAVICSFLERYGAMLDLPELTFPQLERYIQDTSSVPKLLVDLHVKLLRKIGKSVSADRWEKHIVKICQEFNTTWAWELEKKGYKEMTVECKTGILKYLCESQFDDNVKFKTAINDEDPDKMRLQPIGRDKDGLMYWFQLDQYNNVRVYVEEQDDLDGSSWKCIVRERNDLAEILALLKTQIDPSLLTKKDLEEGAQDENKENGGVKKIEDSSTEDEDKDPKETNGAVLLKTESKEEHPLNEDSKLSVSDAKSPSNDIKDNRTESDSNVKPEKTEADGNDFVNRQTIKEEPVEVSESKEGSDTSATEALSEKSSMTLQAESGEEAKKKSPEELQRAMKNDQQAKIPLKKREMKLSEDFDGNSGGSIIVRNPSLPQVKDVQNVDGSHKSETVKPTTGDQANGDTHHPNEKSFNNGLSESAKEKEIQKDSTDGKEKIAKGVSGHASEAAEAKEKNTPDLPTVKDGKRDEQTRVTNESEEAMEVATSSESERQKKPAKTKEEKESPEASDKTKQPVSKEAKSTTAELSPSSKEEAINPSGNSLDIKEGEERHTKCKEGVVKTPIIENKAVASMETQKKPLSKNSQESDENKGTDVVIAPSSSKSNHPEKTEKKEVASKDTGITEVKDKEKGTCTKGFEKPSDCKRTAVISEETGNPIPRAEGSEPTEKPFIIKENETQSSKKESVKAVSQIETETPSVIQKTEKLKQSNDTEKLDSSKEANASSVIIKADKPPLEKDTRSLDSSKEKGESSVLKKTEKQEGSKPTETSVITKEKSKHPTETDSEVVRVEKEKSGIEKDSEKAITSKDKKVTTTPQVSETKIEKQTCPRPDLVKKVEKLATSVDTTSTKDTNKSFSTETETSETSKEAEKPAEKKPGAATEKLAVPSEDSNQQSPETSASDKESKEPVGTSVKKSTDENGKIQEGSRQGSTKEEESKKSSEDEVSKDQTPMECEEPLKEPATSTEELGRKPSLNSTKDEKTQSRGLEKGDDAKAGGLPETESKKENGQDETPSAEAEKSSDTKTEEVSVVDKPKDKEEKEKKEEKEEKVDEKDEGDSTATQKAAEEGKGSSEVQEEGIRLKIKIPAHRRKAELQREERGDSESDTGEGRSLRRSPRICRPTPKVVEFQDRKMEKKQATSRVEKEEKKEGEEEEEEEEKEKEGEEEEDDDEGKTVQKKPREKKVDEDGQPKSKGRKRRKTRWSNTRTRRKKKGSDDGSDDEESESSYEEDTEDEDDSDEDYKVERNRKRRNRNRNRQRRSSDDSTSSDDDLPPNDDPCKHCGLPNHPELILLCDSCDNGYHTACLRPPLMIIPDGEWFCPPCQHKQLCDKLEEQLQNLDAALKKRERAERRKERLVYVGISVENIITSSVDVEEEKEAEVIKVKKEVKKSKSWGRRSTRAKKSISYRFDEFDEAIEEAIEEDIKEAEGGGAGRGKDMANITGHRGKDMSTILQGEEGKENGRPPRPIAGQRRKKRRRLNDLDSDSTMEEEESEDEFRLSDSTEEEEFVVSENEAESDAEINSNNGSDFGSTGTGPQCRSSRSRRPAKRRKATRQPRRRRRPRGYSDDEEEETDEEDEEEMVTEGSSEFSDSDLDMSRRRSRRSKKKQVNYCETSESEGSRAGTNRDKVKSLRRLTSTDSEASLSRGSDNEERERRVKRKADSSEKESRQERRRLSLKRRRASEDDDDDSDESEEEERPVRKRVNRIDSDDEDEEEEEEDKKGAVEPEDEEGLGKVANPLDYNLVELPTANGQNPMKGLEGFMNRPGAGGAGGAIGAPDLMTHLGPKNAGATPAVAIAPNGLVSQEMAPQDDDEDDLLGVTDLVDYVCNSEQL